MQEKSQSGLLNLAIALASLMTLVSCQTKSETGLSQIPETSEIVKETVEIVEGINKIETCKALDPGNVTSEEYNAFTKEEKAAFVHRATAYLENECDKP